MIKSFVGGKDVFAILPTGYVKRYSVVHVSPYSWTTSMSNNMQQ